ncbi:outer membrane beta-barrel protein [Dysgonomonas sp. 520]|uniref:outer membrane beta-barrel protein n=1 Tax=Dysgonomonas sp. 520 TaxID=2302931 RepID=UPI0013D60C35|nr:outer membrane beta-barrel protein [Dysgonomonas sp. 520]NDW11221.1 porin family protein [Dysgonomonas sp. 520]
MKKLFLAIALVFGAVTANAQDVGQIWVGGNVGFSTTKIKGFDRMTDYTILPEFGYVLNENFGIGVNLGYSHQEALDVDGMGDIFVTNQKGFAIAPFVRYTFLKGDIGGLFLDGGVKYINSKEKGAGDRLHEFEVGITPGVAISISDKVSLIGKFGFLGYSQGKSGDHYKTETFELGLNMNQFSLGVNLIF